MNRATLGKKAAGQMSTSSAEQGGRGTKNRMAEIGMITKSSGDTRANQTTSTGYSKGRAPKSFLDKLGEMHTAERELTLALPLVAKAANSKDLKALLQTHLQETKGHVKTLEAVAESLGVELPTIGCKPMTKLIAQGVKVIGKRLVSHEQDAELIAVGKKIEQFEIEQYAELCTVAEKNDYAHELARLTSVLNQEKLAAELLAAPGLGQTPLKKLVQKASLKKAGSG